MNAALTNLQTKVDDNIEAKKTAAPDPSKVKAEDLSEVLTGVISYLDNLSAPPEAPAGVSFTTSPTFTIGTNSITESASVVNNNGATVNVPGATIAVPYAATGKKRLDSIVVNYLATPAVYERIAGDEVIASAIAARKSIPANRLFAHDIDVTDGAIAETSGPGTTYTFDTTPTADSTNPVTSGGIKTYADGLITTLKSGVVSAGDTLAKLYALIQANTTTLAGKASTATATTTTAGLMSAADKIKVDAIQTDSKEIYFSPEANIQEFIVYGKFLSAELATFDGSTSTNYSFKWKTDGGTYSSSISTIASLTTALSGLTATSKTWIQVTSNYASVAAILIRYSK